MKGKDFLSIADLSTYDINNIISTAVQYKVGSAKKELTGRTQALLFEKPSLRTRVSFEIAMQRLGGETLYLSPAEVNLGKRESIRDVALVLSRYVDVITARTFAHASLEELARYATVPVVNALSDSEHPCQTLADLLTIYERKNKLKGLSIAWVGDGNNVAASLMLGAALCGVNFKIATPKGYEVPSAILQKAQSYAKLNNSEILCTDEPDLAVRGTDVVYTDTWISMGQEQQAEDRRKIFAPYQVNEKLIKWAADNVILMHCLPAHHGEEVAEGILYGEKSVVFDQAENRLHAQQALLSFLFTNKVYH